MVSSGSKLTDYRREELSIWKMVSGSRTGGLGEGAKENFKKKEIKLVRKEISSSGDILEYPQEPRSSDQD